LVWLLRCKPQTANRTEPRGSVQKPSEPSAVFCGFGLDWFGLRFFYWVGSVLNTPYYNVSILGRDLINK